MSAKQKIEEMNFEAAMEELETIVRQMESGETALEDSIKAYERGITLKKHCEKKLNDAQSKLEKITINDDGSAKTQPLDPE